MEGVLIPGPGMIALGYWLRGWTPFPVAAGTKQPLVKWAPVQKERPSPGQLAKWWTEWPDASIGLATGTRAGLVVVDVDAPEAQARAREHCGDGLRETVTVRTARGRHLYFQHPGGQRVVTRAGVLPGVDVRGDGGFVIAPPSIHSSGAIYTVERDGVALAPCPAWLLRNGNGYRAQSAARGDAIPKGERNAALTSLAGTMRRRGMSQAAIEAALLAENRERCRPPLPEAEVRGIAASVARYAPETSAAVVSHRERVEVYTTEPTGASPKNLGQVLAACATLLAVHMFLHRIGLPTRKHTCNLRTPTALRARARLEHQLDPLPIPRPSAYERLQMVRLSEVIPEPVSWLWPGRIPRGKLTLLIGDPGQGKSLLTLDIAARLSVGAPWPDGGTAPYGYSIFVAVEDDVADTIRPRLSALGGDPECASVIQGTKVKGVVQTFSLTRDLIDLEQAIEDEGASLVVVDPVNAYFGAEHDSYRDTVVRAVLAPVASLAARTEAAVIGVMHLTKAEERSLLHRVQGSIGFVGLSRAVWAVQEDPKDKNRRRFSATKLNLGPKPPSLAFRIVDRDGTAAIEWEEAPVADEVGLPEEGSELERAKDFLREALKGGQFIMSTELEKDAKGQGITVKTLQRARSALGVETKKVGGIKGGWACYLPERPAGEQGANSAKIAK